MLSESILADSTRSASIEHTARFDLAILIDPSHPWLTTEQFLDALDAGLEAKLAP